MTNKINYRQIALCFCVPWFVAYLCLFGIQVKRYDGPVSTAITVMPVMTLVLSLLVPAFLLFLTGLVLNKVVQSRLLTYKVALISIAVLTALDQGIKWLIMPMGDAYFPIIEVFLYYRGILNTGHFLNSVGIYPPRLSVFTIPPLWALLHCVSYRWAKFTGRSTNYLNMAWIFLYAAMLCYVLDSALYGGTYDYIELRGVVVFDLKDTFALTALCAVFQGEVYGRSKEDRKKWRDPFGTKYMAYEYGNIRQWLRDRNVKGKG